jgi:IclR family KDG regulon transcriptional repressor
VATPKDSKSVVNSVLRACQLMELVASQGPEVTLSRLAEESGLTRPTTHRLLSTLEMAGWIRRTQPGRYGLTMRAFIIGSSASGSEGLRDLARPLLSSLAMTSGDTSYLLVPYEGKALCLDRIEGPYPVRVHNVKVGDRISLLSGAAPLAILAFRPDLLEGLEIPGGSARKVVEERLLAARERGYIVSPDDLLPGITAIGAPVFDRNGTAVAGLSIAGTNDRFSEGHVESAVKAVLSAAVQMSRLLGHAPETSAV